VAAAVVAAVAAAQHQQREMQEVGGAETISTGEAKSSSPLENINHREWNWGFQRTETGCWMPKDAHAAHKI
jgi:hypothetical protein